MVLGLRFPAPPLADEQTRLWLRNLWLARLFFRSRLFAPFSEQFEETVDPIESAAPSMPAAATESYRSDIGVVACRPAVFPPIPGVAACPFAAFPATPGRNTRLIRIEFQEGERRWIKPLRFHQHPGCNASFDEFVRHEETQRPIRAAGQQAGVGQMNMGEGFLALGPALAGAPELCDNASLHRLLISRRKQRQGARLIVEDDARATPFVSRHPGKHRSGAERQPFARAMRG
jgi:hypothetical protein